jgi:predicted nucleic acid-binding protein
VAEAAIAYLDTNVIIRFLTGDDLAKQQAAATLLGLISQRNTAVCASHAVFAEAVFVLGSKRLYALSRARVAELLVPIAGLPNMRIHQRAALIRAFELYTTTKLHFVDALIAALAEAESALGVYSFDTGFDSIPGVRRLDPADAR